MEGFEDGLGVDGWLCDQRKSFQREVLLQWCSIVYGGGKIRSDGLDGM